MQPSPDAARRVQGDHQQLQRGVRPRGRRRDQRRAALGHQPVSRHRYEFLRNTDLNAAGFTFSPAVFQKPTLQRNQFGVTIGGPIHQEQALLLRRLRRLPPVAALSEFRFDPDLTTAAGILPVTVVDPLTRRVYPAKARRFPLRRSIRLPRRCLSGLPAPNGPGRVEQLEALLLIRDYSDKYDAKLDYQINDKMTAFLRFNQRKDLQYYQPDIPGPPAATATATSTPSSSRRRPVIPGRLTPRRCLKRASASRMSWPGRSRRTSVGQSMEISMAFRACRLRRISPAD